MRIRSELEEYLTGCLAEGDRDSSGAFTLARDKALEKLGNFSLPREDAWVLKVVQAAVASQATSLEVRQTSNEIQFSFGPARPWSLAEVEAAFVNPEPEADRGLDHLKRGLWSVSLNGMKPFKYSLPQQKTSLIWNGAACCWLGEPCCSSFRRF
jgi:hypothetical protein